VEGRTLLWLDGASMCERALAGESDAGTGNNHRDIGREHGERPERLESFSEPERDAEIRGGGIVVTEIATPTPELARVSNASIPATPTANATAIVSSLTCASPCNRELSIFREKRICGVVVNPAEDE
jgi:hypothetical protein